MQPHATLAQNVTGARRHRERSMQVLIMCFILRNTREVVLLISGISITSVKTGLQDTLETCLRKLPVFKELFSEVAITE